MDTLKDMQAFTAEVRKLTGRKGVGGPKTPAGKIKAALNSVRWGLAGKGLVMPGEDVADVERRLDAVFIALAPQNAALAELAGFIGDDFQKMARLARVEKNLTAAKVEEMTEGTAVAEQAARMSSAISALGSALQSWEMPPTPTKRTADFTRRLQTMMKALELVVGLIPDLPADVVEHCEVFVARLVGKAGDEDVPVDAYAALFEAAGRVMTVLMDRGAKIETEEQELRQRLAQLAVPDEADIKRLTRYRKMIEDGLQRRLDTYRQLRELSSAVATPESAERSRAYRVQLRLVG